MFYEAGIKQQAALYGSTPNSSPGITNKNKTMTSQERIKADAEKAASLQTWTDRIQHPVQAKQCDNIYAAGYEAGATAEHDRAQVLVDALEAIEKWCIESGLKSVAIDDPKGMAIYHSLHLAKNALEQWKSGKGKEVEGETGKCTCSAQFYAAHGRCHSCPIN